MLGEREGGGRPPHPALRGKEAGSGRTREAEGTAWTKARQRGHGRQAGCAQEPAGSPTAGGLRYSKQGVGSREPRLAKAAVLRGSGSLQQGSEGGRVDGPGGQGQGWDRTWQSLGTQSPGWGGGRVAEVGWLVTP